MNWMWQRLDIDGPSWAPHILQKGNNKTVAPYATQTQRKSSQQSYGIELRPLISCRAIVSEWSDLVTRAVEPNIFAGPEMMLAAAHHLPARQAPAALIVRASADKTSKLLALIPLETAAMPLLPDAVRGYVTPYHPVGVPLIDKTSPVAIMKAVLDWMAGHGHHMMGLEGQSLGVSGMLWKHVPLEGAFAQALTEAARQSNRQLDVLARTHRPVLNAMDAETKAAMAEARNAKSGTAKNTPDFVPTKIRSDLDRRRRRLAEHGALRFEEMSSGQPMRDAMETFLVLEASSWKGVRGTAMVQNIRTSCFIRTASRMMARNGQCSVHTLFAGEQPVAAIIALESGNRSWGYKIAYDENFAKMSPALVLLAEIIRRQHSKNPGHVFDSCMDNPNVAMSHFWNATAAYGDLMVATSPGNTPGALAMRMRERLRRNLRDTAKTIYRKAMGYTR